MKLNEDERTEFTIESGIPVPTNKKITPKFISMTIQNMTKAIRALEVNQSFEVGAKYNMQRARYVIRKERISGEVTGKRYIVRLTDIDKQTYRLWRIK